MFANFQNKMAKMFVVLKMTCAAVDEEMEYPTNYIREIIISIIGLYKPMASRNFHISTIFAINSKKIYFLAQNRKNNQFFFKESKN